MQSGASRRLKAVAAAVVVMVAVVVSSCLMSLLLLLVSCRYTAVCAAVNAAADIHAVVIGASPQ